MLLSSRGISCVTSIINKVIYQSIMVLSWHENPFRVTDSLEGPSGFPFWGAINTQLGWFRAVSMNKLFNRPSNFRSSVMPWRSSDNVLSTLPIKRSLSFVTQRIPCIRNGVRNGEHHFIVIWRNTYSMLLYDRQKLTLVIGNTDNKM